MQGSKHQYHFLFFIILIWILCLGSGEAKPRKHHTNPHSGDPTKNRRVEPPTSSGNGTKTKQPNIVFILADDMGWNDVGYHGSSQIPTPNIDQLANEGVKLLNHYVSPLCTPTRSSLLTGRHPIHTGMQTLAIFSAQPYGLPLSEITIAQRLKPLGYSTHLIGKWHLGFFADEYTPTRRGFDTFLGFYTGQEDYYTRNATQNFPGYDFHKNGEVYRTSDEYVTELFTDEADKLIRNHDPEKPMFLMLSHLAPHAATPAEPLQAPQKYIDRVSYIENEGRRIYAAMVSALDDSIGKLTQTLKDTGLYDNTIIVFSSDNGGALGNRASNWPFRGLKNTLWEGALHVPAFVHSPLLEKPGRISEDLLHVTDWFPTLLKLAGGKINELRNLDGFDIWDTLSKGAPSPRTEILHNIDPVYNFAALRRGNYKIIAGSGVCSQNDGWFGPVADNPVVQCGSRKPVNASRNCVPQQAPCLFDIKNDPCEYYNIAAWNQDLVQELLNRINAWSLTAVQPVNMWNIDPRANPRLHHGNWVPWVNLPQA